MRGACDACRLAFHTLPGGGVDGCECLRSNCDCRRLRETGERVRSVLPDESPIDLDDHAARIAAAATKGGHA